MARSLQAADWGLGPLRGSAASRPLGDAVQRSREMKDAFGGRGWMSLTPNNRRERAAQSLGRAKMVRGFLGWFCTRWTL